MMLSFDQPQTWLSVVMANVLIWFVMPVMILSMFYLSVVMLHIYKRVVVTRGGDWYWARKLLQWFWGGHGKLWHGYEVKGIENIPNQGPALLIYYHGAIPIDLYYLLTSIFAYNKRVMYSVVDHFFLRIPGFSILAEVLNLTSGSRQTCVKLLQKGNLVAIAPGGVLESQFSHNYEVMWNNRVGFAKVALETNVPILPVFTENLRESYRTVSIGKSILMKLYHTVKLPVSPVYGGFPVKLTTHIGAPVKYDKNTTPEELQRRVVKAVEGLIKEHQRIPASIPDAFMDRLSGGDKRSRSRMGKVRRG